MCLSNRRRPAVAISAGLAAWLWTSAADAAVLVAQARTDPIVFGGATYLVDFNGSAPGGTQFQFTTSNPNTRVAIFFNAECAVDGAESKWVDVNILVNPAGPTPETAAEPSNGDNAFCSGNGTISSDFSLDGWVSAATIATITLPAAGTHTVRVQVDGGHAGVTRFDDMSLIVMR